MMKIIVGNEAGLLREKYIECFIDTKLEYYSERIQKMIMCSDGMCYTGYLWDCLKSKFLMSEKECLRYIENTEKIYVFWDIHSQDRIFIPNYWKYPKEAIIEMQYIELLENINNFPEDIYVVDETFQWSVILTHETSVRQERYCLFSENRKTG